MLFLLTSRTRADLTAVQYTELASLAKVFYAAMPTDVTIRGEWAAVDKSRNYTLLEAPDIDVVRRIQQAFVTYTVTDIVPVVAISGWSAT